MNKSSCAFEVIYNTIHSGGNSLSVSTLCSIAGVSRSGYYAWVNAAPLRERQEQQDRDDFDLILSAYRMHGYSKGAQGIHMALLHLEPPVSMNLKKIRRLMHKFHLSCPYPETIVHSDQGCHYTSHKFINLLYDRNLRQSMSRCGNCWDNAPQESFFGHMKDHIKIPLAACTEYEQVASIVDDYMDYYNNRRYQWHLAKLSPNEFYNFITTGVYPLDIPHKPSVPVIPQLPSGTEIQE